MSANEAPLDSGAVSADGEMDIYRDTWVRFLGYANEVGEAFRPLVSSRWVLASYAVAAGYVGMDTRHKYYLFDLPADHELESRGIHGQVEKKVAERRRLLDAADCLIWQTFASVAIPGLVINRSVKALGWAVRRAKISGPAATWGPTIAGLAMIPLIVAPIDHAVHKVMDGTFRVFVEDHLKSHHEESHKQISREKDMDK